ncbi:flagellar hook-associated protein 2 [Salipaludibacillus daqingensis]|uniref:flagellar hook-associated protein 2 n=1 Tax=Salipaludibacillus daqingensis TaxID=3041001 RepID=UPI0024743C5B|nr:flagellar hook-associated protein 2 [Salipaludibacillus daqingensis]
MRMSGFASGMDINQMVGDLMKAERQPIQKMQQDQQELILKMGDYREVNREFMQFRDNTFDTVIRRSNMDAKEVTSSNEGLVSASASAGAANGAYTISDVELAQSANNFSSEAIVGEGEELDPTTSFIEQHGSYGEGDIIEFGMTTFDENGDEVAVAFTFDETDSLNDIMGEINNSALGVQAFYDNNTQRVSISRKETGVFNPDSDTDNYAGEIKFGATIDEEETSGDFLRDVLNLDEGNESEAQNASFTFNGLEMERQSNNFDINGVNITLNDQFTDPVTLNVSNNTDEIFDTVMGFVDDYNELIEMVDGKVSQEYHRDYAPLTDEQRREMSESEQEMWDERATSGLVRNDRMLTGALNQMRQDFYTPVNADDPNQTFTQITEIGISTTSNYQDRGRLEVDEAQLRSAIEEDPESVFQMFAADGEETEERGVARRIRDSLGGSIEQLSNRAGRSEMASNQQFTIGREIDQASDRISNFERRMQQVEERYWSQFTAMEQAMAKANAQAEQLMSQMGGMGGQPM